MDSDFEAFFKANERRIHFQIHRLGITGEAYAEFYSEGVVALWKAYKEFDAEKGKIGTFLNFRIRYRLLDVLRKKIREAEKMEEAIEEEKTRLDDGNRHRASRMPVLRVNEIALKDPSFWEEVRSRLSDKQWKWVQYFIIADMSIKEIMEIEGVTADAVKGWGQAVRKKLRDQEVRKMLEEMM